MKWAQIRTYWSLPPVKGGGKYCEEESQEEFLFHLELILRSLLNRDMNSLTEE